MGKHVLNDCWAVWYGGHVSAKDMDAHMEELCEQGNADYLLDGINKPAAKRIRR